MGYRIAVDNRVKVDEYAGVQGAIHDAEALVRGGERMVVVVDEHESVVWGGKKQRENFIKSRSSGD